MWGANFTQVYNKTPWYLYDVNRANWTNMEKVIQNISCDHLCIQIQALWM